GIQTGVEKVPSVFESNMLRCIMCGYCEEVCPEQAIFLTKEYTTVGLSRAEMIFPKDKLLEMGGIRPDPIRKWQRLTSKQETDERVHEPQGANRSAAR